MQNVEQEFTKIQDVVEYVLEHEKEARSNDFYLLACVAEHLGADSISDLKEINVSPMTITRYRQHLQNKLGKYPADEEVREYRKHRKNEFKQYIIKQKEAN